MSQVYTRVRIYIIYYCLIDHRAGDDMSVSREYQHQEMEVAAEQPQFILSLIPDINADLPAVADPELPFEDAAFVWERLGEFRQYIDDVKHVAALFDSPQSEFCDWDYVNNCIIGLPFIPETPQHVEVLVDEWYWNLKQKVGNILGIDDMLMMMG